MADYSAGVLKWLENTSWAATIRQSSWLYPGLEILHITGIVILVGGALLFDLRLLGFSKQLPVKALADHLLSWSKRGLFIILPSGVLLFMTNAVTLGHDPVFWIKMGLLILAGSNAIVFHRLSYNSSTIRSENKSLQALEKLAAVISILLWIAIITCGRLLAY